MNQFFTIQHSTGGLYKEKGSKFLSFAISVSSEEEIKSQLEILKKKYYDARHHCYAWVLGLDQPNWRANDDGEPNHSAGDPILGQIKSFELTNVLVVVVRYFGGTKLGVSGLINAYKQAAQEALQAAERKELFEEVFLKFRFPYDLLSTIERLITDFELKVVERDFREECQIHAKIKKGLLDQLKERTKDLYSLKMSTNEESNEVT